MFSLSHEDLNSVCYHGKTLANKHHHPGWFLTSPLSLLKVCSGHIYTHISDPRPQERDGRVHLESRNSFILFICLYILWPHPWHVAAPRLRVELELQLRPMPQPRQHRTQATSVTYATAFRNTGFLTHWARPGIEPASSWILVGFITHWATTGTPGRCILLKILTNQWLVKGIH